MATTLFGLPLSGRGPAPVGRPKKLRRAADPPLRFPGGSSRGSLYLACRPPPGGAHLGSGSFVAGDPQTGGGQPLGETTGTVASGGGGGGAMGRTWVAPSWAGTTPVCVPGACPSGTPLGGGHSGEGADTTHPGADCGGQTAVESVTGPGSGRGPDHGLRGRGGPGSLSLRLGLGLGLLRTARRSDDIPIR